MPPEIGHSHKSQYLLHMPDTQFYIKGNRRVDAVIKTVLTEIVWKNGHQYTVHNLFLQVLWDMNSPLVYVYMS